MHPTRAPAATPSRGHANPRRGVSVSSRWGWGPSASGKKEGDGMKRFVFLLIAFVPLLASATYGDDSEKLLTIDHYVRVRSTVPAIAGHTSQIYVRERVQAGVALRTSTSVDRVVLFIHGAGTSAEVAFDVPFQDYSWMAFLARAGFDVFSVDTTGDGRPNRAPPIDDSFNLPEDRPGPFVKAA